MTKLQWSPTGHRWNLNLRPRPEVRQPRLPVPRLGPVSTYAPVLRATVSWKIGDVRIKKVVELVAPFPLNGLLPAADPDVFVGHLHWLAPHFVDETGNLLVSFHALVVESHGRRIIVDTCIGNDKTRPYNGLSDVHTEFLADFTAAGFQPGNIDTVRCTNLHFDHVGWNTRLVDGKWVPTFPNARYLLGRLEFEHWTGGQDDKGGAQVAFPDSVQPLVDAGLVDLVESDHRMTPEVYLEPSPGHTPVITRCGSSRAPPPGSSLATWHITRCSWPSRRGVRSGTATRRWLPPHENGSWRSMARAEHL
jgi:glyoxylase-like metal-dependent hydrolase (beta-lactamase superfamily II)